MQKIAVLYLARIAEGLHHFERFAESYRQYPAGEDHELIIIYKGDLKSGVKAGAEHIFGGIAHRTVVIPDEGYDIQAYLTVTKQIDHDTLCMFNTFTTLLSPNWLKKLSDQFTKRGIGVAGMSASYESIPSSHKLIFHAVWLAASRWVRFNRKLARQFAPGLRASAAGWMQADTSFYYRLRRFLGDILCRRLPYNHPSLDEEFARHWEWLTSDGALLAPFRNIAPFPNPHIRSNGFMVSRELLLEFRGMGSTKNDCMHFESGPNGLTNRAFEKGLSVVLVGADGIGYAPEEWPASKTFRLENQQNLMASDNQVSGYGCMPEPERQILAYMTWGDYVGPPPKNVLDLGHKFTKRVPLVAAISHTKKPKISVVIPARNRLNLLKDAIFTVLKQEYQSWELVIFDNASTDPIKGHVDSLGESRIRYERSDAFLSVTDSWNRAIDYATGDYVILLGDDDGLVPDFFDKVASLVKSFGEPDFVLSATYQFMHPGVSPSEREGYLASLTNGFFFAGHTWPFLLKASDARAAWIGSVDFRRNFTSNMEAFTFKRSFLDKIRMDGQVIHAPFPDSYLANIAMANGTHILVYPEPLTIAGISTEPFPSALSNNLEKRGTDLLTEEFVRDSLFSEYERHLLPGQASQANYIVTMGHVAKNLPKSVDPNPGIARYRRHQIFAHLQNQTDVRWLWNTAIGKEIWGRLSVSERLWAVAVTLCHFKNVEQIMRKVRSDVSGVAFTPIQKRVATGEFATLREVFEMLEQKRTERNAALDKKGTPRKNNKSRRGAAIRRQWTKHSPQLRHFREKGDLVAAAKVPVSRRSQRQALALSAPGSKRKTEEELFVLKLEQENPGSERSVSAGLKDR
jgi:glycosyltransferase involved in cell wall biosynthesis